MPFTYGDVVDEDDHVTGQNYSYIQPGKPFGFFLAGLAVLGSFITFGLTGPFALKALTAALAPIAGGKIANAIASVEKIGNVKFIGPILTKIGEGFQKVASLPYISHALNFMRIGQTIQAGPAAVIGLGAVIGGLISTVGTLVDKFAYKPWLRFWHGSSTKRRGSGLEAHPEGSDLRPLMGANETLQSPPISRTPDRSLGEGSGTKPLFAARSAAPTASATAAHDDRRPIASFNV